MKILCVAFALLMQTSCIYSLSDYDDDTYYPNNNNQKHQHQHFNSFGNTFTSGSGSSSVSQSNINGNNIIVSRRMGPNDESEDYISITKPKIIFDGDYVTCSTLICPPNTFKCVVTSEAIIDNIQIMKTVAECFDKQETSVARKEYEERNPFPETNGGPPYSRHAQVDRDGTINVEDSTGRNVYNSKKLTEEEHKKLMEKVNQQTQRINEQIHQQQLQLQQQMEALQANMQKTFGKNFPFGNTGFPFPSNFPFYSPVPNYYYPPTNVHHTNTGTYNPYPYQPQQTHAPNYQPSFQDYDSRDDY